PDELAYACRDTPNTPQWAGSGRVKAGTGGYILVA
ncbi:unnamed protein product, partial [marine sediment metagenome]